MDTVKNSYSYDDLPGLLTMMTGDEKHTPSATSALDVIWVLYDKVLKIDPGYPNNPERDRFLLSKGHGPMAYYAVLAAKGFFPVATLPSFARYDSVLGQHPDRMLIPGVEIASGSLGHGLPIATGVAAALKAKNLFKPRVYCLIGDAELDEGSNQEAIAFAARMNLSNLTALIIDNASASLGWPGGIGARFAVEGWSMANVDGRDHTDIEAGIRGCSPDKPHAVVAVVGQKE